MNNSYLRVLIGVVTSVIAFRIMTVKPIRNYLLTAILDGAVFLIKRKLR